MKILLGRSRLILVLSSTIALLAVVSIVFYFDLDVRFLQSEQYLGTGLQRSNVPPSYSVKSEFQAMVEIVKKRSDLCSSMSKTSTSSSTKKQKKPSECTRSCSQLAMMDKTLQRQKINLTHNLNMNSFDLFTELLPYFPCFPLSGCRCPAPECILEKRTDTFAETFRQHRKLLSEMRNEARLQFHYFDNSGMNNMSTIYEQFTTIHEKKFLEVNSEKFRAIHDEYLCVQNPFYEQPKAKVSHRSNGIPETDDHDDDPVDELHCRNPNRENNNNEKKGDPLPIAENSEIQKKKIDVANNNNSSKQNFELLATKNVNRFKRRTSWGFSRWYDWKINTENNAKFQFVFPSNQLQEVDNNNDNIHSDDTTSSPRKNNPEEQEPETVIADGTNRKINERNNNNDDEELRISGGYDDEGVYRIKNLCLTPEGKPFGYFGPKDDMEQEFRPLQNSVFGLKAVSPVKPFHGSSEAGRLASKISDVVQDWISHIPASANRQSRKKYSYSPLDDGLLSLLNFGQLPFPPPFFVEGKFMLMGVDWKSDNPGHALYRFLAARNIAKKVWGMSSKKETTKTKAARTTGYKVEQDLAQEYLQSESSKYDNSSYEDFHVIYLVETKSDAGEKTLAGYKYFYDLLGSSWSTILNRPAANAQERSTFFSSKFLKKLKFSSSSSSSPQQLSNEQKSKMYHKEFLDPADRDDDDNDADGEKNSDGSEKQQHQKFLRTFFQSSMVCFKEIVVAHTCGTKSCSLQKRYPSNGYHVPYLQKMSNAQNIFLRYFRLVFIDRCLRKEKIHREVELSEDVSGRDEDNEYDDHDNNDHKTTTTSSSSMQKPKTTITKVTLLARKTYRVDLGLASAIPAISARLKSLSSSSSSFQLRIVSQQDLTPKRFLQIIHHETDILIGSMGGSLSYSWLLKNGDDKRENPTKKQKSLLLLLSSPSPSPSSSVIAEITGLRSCAFVPFNTNYRHSKFWAKHNINNNNSKELLFHDPKKAQGWNLHSHCDFPAMARAVGTQHLSVSLPKFSTKGIWRGKREKNYDLAAAEEYFIFRVGGGRNQNNSWTETLLARRRNQKSKSSNLSSALSMIHFVANEILSELNGVNNKSRSELKSNNTNTNETQILYDHLFTEEMSVLRKNIQSAPIPSIMISSSSSREEDLDDNPVLMILSTGNATTVSRKKNINNQQGANDNDKRHLQRRMPIRNRLLDKAVMDRAKERVKSRKYPLGVRTPVTYVGVDLYLQILESCLCRHFEIKMMMLLGKANRSSSKKMLITTRDEIENFLVEKCPWRPKDVKYAKLKWGVDS